MQLVDTHCHIHFDDFGMNPIVALQNAKNAGVEQMILVGCTLEDSRAGVEYANVHPGCFASVGIHPHEAKNYTNSDLEKFSKLADTPKLVAIGECGLDYYYNHSPNETQKKLFKFQLELAQKHNLPLIFHVREAFSDFFAIVDEYKGLRGVVHSFSATTKELSEVLERGFYIGLNGIMTFTKEVSQLEAAKEVPLERLLLETDAPFLTPKPFRGTINEPKNVEVIASFLSELRGESFEHIAEVTTKNAEQLFNL